MDKKSSRAAKKTKQTQQEPLHINKAAKRQSFIKKHLFGDGTFYRLPPLFALFAGLIFGLVVTAVDLRSSISLLNKYRPSVATRLYDRNGIVFAELYRHRQELVSFHEIPPHVIHAFLAVEDTNFYNHFGIDFRGILRAAFVNLMAGKIVQGGSTLSQQLAKQIYVNAEGHRYRSFVQKIRETVLALQIEEELSKDEILEAFFNVIYLGHGCKGLACAARLYFDKKVSDLSLAEGAMLARLPRAPVVYSPFKNPKRAREVHLYVLRRMAAASYLEETQVEKLHRDFWEEYWPKIIVRSPSQSAWGTRLNEAPYFTEYVRQILEAAPEVGAEALYSQSLKIYTTLDIQHQRIAQAEMEKMRTEVSKTARYHALSKGVGGVDFELFNIMQSVRMLFPVPTPVITEPSPKELIRKAIEEGSLDGLQILSYLSPADNETAAFDFFRRETNSNLVQLQVQQAFVSVQPQSGYITAMIGGSRFSPRNQFNRVLQARRQPGSAFKVFVYGSALEQRSISSLSPISDSPFLRAASDGSSWTPENYEPGFRGLVPARRALASSLNTCAVELYFKIGPEVIVDFASRLMKVSAPEVRFKAEPPLALGASEITPMELNTAMAVIANEGREVIPFAVRYVRDGSENIIYSQEDKIRKILAIKTQEKKIQVIEPGLAYILRDMLEYVSTAGTARHGLRNPWKGGFRGELASKTGTTSNYSDAWITGFNSEYAVTVWFGFDKSSVTLGPGQSGGGIAAPVMGRFFREIYKGKEQLYPRFTERSSRPKGVIQSSCQGLALTARTIKGVEQKLEEEGGCAGQRIYDERTLLMKELGITPEDLGKEEGGRVEFR